MRRRRTNLEERLGRALRDTPAIDFARLERTRRLANAEAARWRGRERISFFHLLCKQFGFIGWRVWGAQGLLLLLIGRVLVSLYGRFFWESPHYMMRVLTCLSVLAAMSALPYAHRAVRYRMHEVEAATCFSSAKLLMARLTVLWAGDVLLLAGILFVTVSQTPVRFGSASFYLSLPFLLVSGASLFLLGHLPPKRFFAGSMGLCLALLLLVLALPARYYPSVERAFSVGRAALFVIPILFSAEQCRHILQDGTYAEMQIGH